MGKDRYKQPQQCGLRPGSNGGEGGGISTHSGAILELATRMGKGRDKDTKVNILRDLQSKGKGRHIQCWHT